MNPCSDCKNDCPACVMYDPKPTCTSDRGILRHYPQHPQDEEREKLRREVAGLRREVDSICEGRDAAQAECKRLREELQKYRDGELHPEMCFTSTGLCCDERTRERDSLRAQNNKLATEVERLGRERDFANKQLSDQCSREAKAAEDHEREVEQLRAEVERLKGWVHRHHVDRTEADRQLDAIHEIVQPEDHVSLVDAVREMAGEEEKLRAQVANLIADRKLMCDQVEALEEKLQQADARIARVREASK